MRRATSHPILHSMIPNAPVRADILVSELLGSFGDNEFSPEYLDVVQRCGLLKDDCSSMVSDHEFSELHGCDKKVHDENGSGVDGSVVESQMAAPPPLPVPQAPHPLASGINLPPKSA
eukprot:6361338-Ditylum_brightwellii.AAC.1